MHKRFIAVLGLLVIAVLFTLPAIASVVLTWPTGGNVIVDRNGTRHERAANGELTLTDTRHISDYLAAGFKYKRSAAFGNSSTTTCTKGDVVAIGGKPFHCWSSNRVKPITVE